MKSDPKTEKLILLSRLLTRSGDQAWLFAIPIVMIQIFPKISLPAIIYFFMLMLGNVIITPHVGKFIDSMPRFRLIKIGIGLQMVATTFTLIGFLVFARTLMNSESLNSKIIMFLIVQTIFGISAQVGQNIMEITVANDIVPTAVPLERRATFNSKFRQVDLMTEVGSPVIAGIILFSGSPGTTLTGLILVWLWNFVSYFPEYFLLKKAFEQSKQLRSEKILLDAPAKQGLLKNLVTGLPEFFAQKITRPMIAYALLWVSALSPHGVLLTSYLSKGLKVEEFLIGGFRGAGAAFGLIATLLFPIAMKKFGMLKSSRIFLGNQCLFVCLALFGFHFYNHLGPYFFLIMILCSRVGLYGFSLAEGQMRQTYVSEDVRGRVNGTASALHNLGTLLLFSIGIAFPEPKDFEVLMYASVAAVVIAFLMLITWRPQLEKIDEPFSQGA